MDQDGYCKKKGLDADDPKCARVILLGQARNLSQDTEEYKFAYKSLIERHPNIVNWPEKYIISAIHPLDVVLIYGSEELRCSKIPLYLSTKPKYIPLNKL